MPSMIHQLRARDGRGGGPPAADVAHEVRRTYLDSIPVLRLVSHRPKIAQTMGAWRTRLDRAVG